MAARVCKALGIPQLEFLIVCVAVLGIAVDMGFAVFGRGGRSLHDLIFRTRVVVDTGD